MMERERCPGFKARNLSRAVRKLARPATTPVCQELAARVADGTKVSLALP